MAKLPHSANRQAVLISIRNGKMAGSAHAYVRGNTLKFYEWLDAADTCALPQGPAIWICGDCHVGNLGPVANADGEVEIQIRDFDQTVIGNPAHDLIRLGLSLAMAARGSDLPGVTTAHMIEQLIVGYAQATDPGQDNASGIGGIPGSVHVALKEALRRSWRHLAKERIGGKTVAIPLGKRFWPVSAPERGEIETLLATDELKCLATQLSHRADDASVKVLDMAYWMKGCSSLGRLRFAVLLDVAKQPTKGHDLCLIDIKEAVKAAAPRYRKATMPRDNAQRILEGARKLSPNLGERMVAARLLDRSVFVRELLPQDLKLEIANVSQQEAMKAACYLGQVVGRAHARQMDEATRRAWCSELARNRSKTLDAPSWLWLSILELVATHERGYLEHCRRYSLDTPSTHA